MKCFKMASQMVSLGPNHINNPMFWSVQQRRENKKLRHSGLEYISRSGKTVAAKKQPDQLCNCPQKCGDKIPADIRTRLFEDFYKMADHVQQNNFLQTYIEMRSVHKRLWSAETRIGGRLQRRVSCKYRIPIEMPGETTKGEINIPAETEQRQISTFTSQKRKGPKPVTKLPPVKTVEVCQKAFMNMYAITEKRVRLQREKLIMKSRHEAEERRIEAEEMQTSVSVARDLAAGVIRPLLLSQAGNTDATPVTLPSQILSSIDHDIAVVNNFFRNQLWKPEYIGCDKYSHHSTNSSLTLCD